MGDRSISKHATTKALKAFGDTLTFIDIWLKKIVENYEAKCEAYITAIKQMFNQIPQTMSKALTSKQKVQKLMIDIFSGWYMEKGAKGIPPLKISKLNKKHKIIRIAGWNLKKLYEANKWWNYWRFHLHCNKLEWVDPKTLIKRDKPYSVSSIFFT